MGNRHAFCNPEVTDNPKKLFVCGLPVFREGPAAPPAWLLPVRKFELACVDFHFQITSSFCCNSAAISPQFAQTCANEGQRKILSFQWDALMVKDLQAALFLHLKLVRLPVPPRPR